MIRVVMAIVLACVAGATSADERILAYDSEVLVQRDGSLEVTERIRVRAEGSQIRRGIYRDYPTRYRDRYGNAVVVGFEVLGVERNGEPEDWFTERVGNGVRINTGGDDFLPVPAVHTFTLRYRTTRQLGFFDGHDELYWNAIGHGWVFPIDSGSVEVRLPEPVPIAQMAAEAYTGPQGAKGQDYVALIPAPGVARWRLSRPFAPYEGMSIVLSFPKGMIAAPSGADRIGWLLADNRGVLIALAALVALLVYCVREWRRVGVDPRPGVIIARYDPPDGKSPAALRYLRRMGYDTRCFSADVLALAVSGHLRIHRNKALFKDQWKLQCLPADNEPPAATQTLLVRLFAKGKSELVLDNSKASIMMAAREAHRKALDAELHPRYFERNVGSATRAWLIGGGGIALAFMLGGDAGVALVIGIAIVMLVVLVTFGRLVRAPTREGRVLLDEIEGLKLYLSVAERDELARMAGPDAPPALDAKRYERLLPFAVALEVEDAWTKKFTLAVGAAAAAAATSSIGWYQGGRIGDLGSFSRSIGSSLSSQIASASSPPGSSSGSGGGGSSGGGGGGGGGGGR